MLRKYLTRVLLILFMGQYALVSVAASATNMDDILGVDHECSEMLVAIDAATEGHHGLHEMPIAEQGEVHDCENCAEEGCNDCPVFSGFGSVANVVTAQVLRGDSFPPGSVVSPTMGSFDSLYRPPIAH